MVYIVSSPFSYSCKKLAQDAENQLEAALGAVSALHKAHATTFVVRSLSLSNIHGGNSRFCRRVVCARCFIGVYYHPVPYFGVCICMLTSNSAL